MADSMPLLAFNAIYLAGLLISSVIRMIYGRRYRANLPPGHKPDVIAGTPRPELAMMLLWGVAQLVAIVYVFTPWLSFADYLLPQWLGWLGAVVFALSVWLLWRSHADLGDAWSPEIEVQREQQLVTTGVFSRIRHPMYAAHLLWSVAQPLLLWNWIAGWLALLAFLPVYLLRAPREEQMMLAEFGEEYRAYAARTGSIIPRLRRGGDGT